MILEADHRMIPPTHPCFIFAYFMLGNLKINQIKMYNRMWGMSSCNIYDVIKPIRMMKFCEEINEK